MRSRPCENKAPREASIGSKSRFRKPFSRDRFGFLAVLANPALAFGDLLVQAGQVVLGFVELLDDWEAIGCVLTCVATRDSNRDSRELRLFLDVAVRFPATESR